MLFTKYTLNFPKMQEHIYMSKFGHGFPTTGDRYAADVGNC
jgi:hypothetical protein